MTDCKDQPNDNFVYLFNSAYRGTYAFNLFKIMASQKGLHVKMRYNIQKNVPQELRNRANYLKLVGHSCFIIFINRYHGKNYEFLPIRKGKIIKAYEDSGYLFTEVKLGDFITMNNEASEFTGLLLSKLKDKNIPQLKDNNPEITMDGNYIIESKETLEENIKSTSDAWLTSIEYISKTKAFDEKFTFIKLRICKVEKNNTYTQLIPNEHGVISISPRCNYVIDSTYFDPTLGRGKYSFAFNFQHPLIGMQQRIFCTSKIDNINVQVASGKNVSLSDKPCVIEVSQIEENIEHHILTVPCNIQPIFKNSIVILLVIMVLILAFGAELEQSQNICLSVWVASKWLISLILIVYAGVKVF